MNTFKSYVNAEFKCNYFCIENDLIIISHNNCALYALLSEELKVYHKENCNINAKSYTNIIKIVLHNKLEKFEVPKKFKYFEPINFKSNLFRINSNKNEVKDEVKKGASTIKYISEDSQKEVIYRKNHFLVQINHSKKEMEISYTYLDSEIQIISKDFIKWEIIHSRLNRNEKFIHGAAVKRNNLLLFICGDSGRGKSSFLMRLVSLGFSIISDDSILIKKNVLKPFSFLPSKTKDFKKRFSIMNAPHNLYKIDKTSFTNKNIDISSHKLIILEPFIWNSEETEYKKTNNSKMLNRINEYNAKELLFFSQNNINQDTIEIIEKNTITIQEFPKNSISYTIFAGNNEKKLMEKLKEIIQNDKKI